MSEKELNEDLIKAIRWAAAEYNYIEELKEELAEIEQEKDIEKEVREISKAIRILRYVGKAERRAANFEEKVETDLKEIYKELSTHLGFDFSKKKEFMDLIREIDIEHDSLVKYTSIYEGLLKEELTKAEAEAQLLADLEGEHSSKKAEKIHTSLLDLIHKIQTQVEDAEKWITALEASLKKAGEILDKVPQKSDDALTRFFEHKEITKEEMKDIFTYRQQCIEHVSKKSTLYSDIPTTFNNYVAVDKFALLLRRAFGFGMTTMFENFKKIFKGKTVIDLGCGPFSQDILWAMIKWGADKYVGVDLEEPPLKGLKERTIERMKIVKERELELLIGKNVLKKIDEGDVQLVEEDSLSYLLKVKNNSSFVISFGSLLFDEILPSDKKGKDYVRFLAHEIGRVTPKGGISFHYQFAQELTNLLKRVGFNEVGWNSPGGLFVKN